MNAMKRTSDMWTTRLQIAIADSLQGTPMLEDKRLAGIPKRNMAYRRLRAHPEFTESSDEELRTEIENVAEGKTTR